MSFNLIILFYLCILLGNINSGGVEIIENDDLSSKFDNQDYLNFYKVPTSKMVISNNGGESFVRKLKHAFDDDPLTFWMSESDNTIPNYIKITFSNTITINRMIYRSVIYTSKRGYGYPSELKIYYKLRNPNNILNDNDDDFLLLDVIISEPILNLVIFEFPEITCDQIKFEWADIQIGIYASASIIMLLFPENKYINELMYNVYNPNDYKYLSIMNKYKDINVIEDLVQNIQDYYDISETIQNIVERIKKVINGQLRYTKRREFTTDPKAGLNIIHQYGDIGYYSRNTLKMSNGGTDRQCTGIFGLANETITIYVDSKDNKALPSIIFTQFFGQGQNWYSSSIKLHKGKNVLIFNNFDTSNFEIKTISGGPIYIENTFTSDLQGQNIKLYIEGGKLFPLFRLNDDEELFKTILNNYVIKYNNNKNSYIDVAEFYSDRVMLTVNATLANDIYNYQKKSPQKNLLNLDELLKKYYIFDGIQFEKNQPYYDFRNQYININFRFTQERKGAQAYAYTELIGIFYKVDLFTMMSSYDISFGGTIPHEIGHMIDVKKRTYQERTNNVLKKFSVEVLEKRDILKSDYDIVLKNLILDNVDPLLRGCQKQNKNECRGFFNEYGDYKQSYMLWWNIECLYHGYWGELNNLYRYNESLISEMTRTESLVFLTNLILGFDTGYYFERFGFTLSKDLFNNTATSNTYKTKMKELIQQGKIDTSIQKKFWYIDYKEYDYMTNYGLGCHNGKESYNIYKVNKFISNNTYYLSFPILLCNGQLGFEIYENDILIDFSYEQTYIDPNKYPKNYIPKYKIVAYDRLLKHSKYPDTYFDHKKIEEI